MSTQLGVSYFSARVARHLAADLRAIRAAGFTWILFPLTEQDIKHSPALARTLVGAARDHGLSPWLSGWGIGGVFGGEGLSEHAHRPPRSPQVRGAVGAWLENALAAAPDALFLDEPRDRHEGSDLGDLLLAWLDRAAGAGVPAHVCFEPDRPWPDPAPLVGRLASVGTDPYDWQAAPAEQARYVARHAAALDRYAARARTGTHLWARAFRVAADREDVALAALRACLASGAGHVGVWSYRAGEAVTSLQSARPDALWDAMTALVREASPDVPEVHEVRIPA